MILVFFISLIFVWGQSCIGKEDSETTSDVLVDIIKPLEEIKPDEIHTAEYEYYNHLIRKGAHVAEFTVIGIEISIILLMSDINKKRYYIVFINSVMSGMLIGLIDETIQIFSERGTQVSDVWFDVIGAGLGSALTCIALSLKKKKQGLAYEKNTNSRSL